MRGRQNLHPPSPLAGEGLGERGIYLMGREINFASRRMHMDQRDFAKALRQNMTDAEYLLWKHLRAHRLLGQKFRCQQPIGPYIVDFVHFGAQLIIECDGGQHNESTTDSRRDAWLREQGYQILRFWNHDILNSTESVLTQILTSLNPLSPRGRGAGGEGEKEQPNP
ncbi:MAG: endonuclease domain-containing protein [Candidatus Thiodiazotropha endolucinida]